MLSSPFVFEERLEVRFCPLTTIGAVVDVGTDPFGTVAAPFTVAAPLLGAFETDLAAVLADFHTFVASSALFARVGVAFGAAHTVRAERLAVAARRLACGTERDAFGALAAVVAVPRIRTIFTFAAALA